MAKKKSHKATRKQKKRVTRYWYSVYRTALHYFGIDLPQLKAPSAKSLDKARTEWKKSTKGISDVNVRDVYRYQVDLEKEQADYNDTPRNADDNRTTDLPEMHDISIDIIESFIDKINAVFDDTMSLIDSAIQGVSGLPQEVYIAMGKTDKIAASRSNLVEHIRKWYEESNNHPEYLALAITRNGELDYTLAVTLVPPSDIIVNFDVTLENLSAIWQTIEQQAQDEAEADYYTGG